MTKNNVTKKTRVWRKLTILIYTNVGRIFKKIGYLMRYHLQNPMDIKNCDI
jgi:hypothetical protein